jgi:serine/threonine protein kinase
MLELLTCPRGHFWERTGEGPAGAACPECGAPPETLPLLPGALGPATAASPRAELPPPAPPVEPPLFDDAGCPVVTGYEVLEDLGRSPTGVRLYRAKQTIVNREVLLKVVAAREDASQRAWGSLRGEASALGRISHPNIVQVHEAGERDRQLFYNAVELVDGPTLAQKVADKPLPFAQVARLMELLARAIDEAHEQGVLHRNLKPSSILLQRVSLPAKSPALADPGGGACRLHSGTFIPRITDFGLARRPIEGDPTDVDLYGDQAGFLSPEQAWGRARDITTTTDVYGLGAILYFLLTGRAPFRGPSLPDVLDAIQTADLAPPSNIRSVPDDLESICRRCLARQPRRRYASAGALADDLRRAQLLLPLACKPSSAANRFGKWLRRKPALAGLIVVLFLGVLSTLIAYGMGGSEEPKPASRPGWPQPDPGRLWIDQAELRSKMNQREQFLDYQQKLLAAERELLHNRPEQAQAILNRCEDRLRGFEWHYLSERAAGRGEVKLAGFDGVTAVAFHPSDEQFLAVASTNPKGKGQVRLLDVQNRQDELKPHSYDEAIYDVCFSPDGQSLVIAGKEQVRSLFFEFGLNARRGDEKWVRIIPDKRITGLAFHPTGQTLIGVADDGTLVRLQAHTGAITSEFRGSRLPRRENLSRSRVVYRSNGQEVVTWTSGDGDVRLWNVDMGRQVQHHPGVAVEDIACAGSKIAIARADGKVYLEDDLRGRLAFEIGPLPGTVKRLAFSPDGARLAGACSDGSVRIWAFVGDSAVLLLEIKGAAANGLAFSPSGKGLAGAADKEVRLWGVAGE